MLSLQSIARADVPAVLRVGAGMIEPQAQAYYALEMGFFSKRGLNLQIQPMRSGSATAAAVSAGDLQIGVSNTFSLALAHQHGVPLVIIAPGSVHDYRVATELAVVAPSSPIMNAKDLNGKVIGGASVAGMDQLAMEAFIDKGGGDLSTVKFVEIPPSTMTDALLQGRIAAVHLSNPDLDAAGSRVRSIGNAEDAIAKVFMQTAWFTTTEWLEKNKDAAHRFSDAVVAAGQWAMANPQPAAAILQKYLSVSVPRAKQHFASTLDTGMIQVMLDSAAHYKMLPAMRAADFIWNGK